MYRLTDWFAVKIPVMQVLYLQKGQGFFSWSGSLWLIIFARTNINKSLNNKPALRLINKSLTFKTKSGADETPDLDENKGMKNQEEVKLVACYWLLVTGY